MIKGGARVRRLHNNRSSALGIVDLLRTETARSTAFPKPIVVRQEPPQQVRRHREKQKQRIRKFNVGITGHWMNDLPQTQEVTQEGSKLKERALSQQGYYSNTDNKPDLLAFTERWKRDLRRDHKGTVGAKDGKEMGTLQGKVSEDEQPRPLISQGSPLSIQGGLPNSQADDLLSAEDSELELGVDDFEEELGAEDPEKELGADQAGFLDAEHTQKLQTVQKGEDDYKPTMTPAQGTLHTDQKTEGDLSQTILTTINTTEQPDSEQRNQELGTEKQKDESRNDGLPPQLPPRYINTQATASEQDKSKYGAPQVDDRIPQAALPSRSLLWRAVQSIRSFILRPRVPEGFKSDIR